MIAVHEALSKSLVVLVGSNPLPNYLSACALRPSRVALVYTEETKGAKDRLRRELARVLGEGVAFEEAFVVDATCATTVRRVLDPLMSKDGGREVLLNYTGGTKVMSAHARLAFCEAKGKQEYASYLDEGGKDKSGKDHQPRLRFDNNTSKAFSESTDIPLTLSTVLALHGITHKSREAKSPAPTIDDAREILCKVLQDGALASKLYCERERLEKELKGKPAKAVDAPFRAGNYNLNLSLPEFPTSVQLAALENADEKKSWFKQWYSFIGGEWLEYWVEEQLRTLASELKLDPGRDLTVGVNAKRETATKDDPPMEIDIAIIRGYRSYFISCTTDTTKKLCKSKLFEIAVRSRQIGGDLARAALVCLADEQTVSALQTDIDDVWGASNTTKVFGRSAVRAWSDCDGKQPNRHSLKVWMES